MSSLFSQPLGAGAHKHQNVAQTYQMGEANLYLDWLVIKDEANNEMW